MHWIYLFTSLVIWSQAALSSAKLTVKYIFLSRIYIITILLTMHRYVVHRAEFFNGRFCFTSVIGVEMRLFHRQPRDEQSLTKGWLWEWKSRKGHELKYPYKQVSLAFMRPSAFKDSFYGIPVILTPRSQKRNDDMVTSKQWNIDRQRKHIVNVLILHQIASESRVPRRWHAFQTAPQTREDWRI